MQGNLLIPPAMEAKKCDSEGCPDGVAEGLAAAFGDKALVHTMFKNGSLDTFREYALLMYGCGFHRVLSLLGQASVMVSQEGLRFDGTSRP
jgi:hypothetical protein